MRTQPDLAKFLLPARLAQLSTRASQSMAVSAFLPALLVIVSARVWAATTHQVPWELGERVLKANRHLNPRVYDYYVQKGYRTCQHHPQIGWLHLHRRVSVGECAECA